MSSTITLNRLLVRLEQSLSDTSRDQHLKSSQYERNRVGANIEHARSLLLTLERQAATVRIQSQRQQQQADLQQKRDLIKKLSSKLRTLNEAGEDDDDEDEGSDESEDVLSTYAPARKDVEAGLEIGESQAQRIDERQQQEIRARRPLQGDHSRDIATTSAREQLLSGASRRADPTADPNLSGLQRTEKMMSHNRFEQDNLTDGLLSLARALKESSIAFGSSLETEKEVMKRAESGLDKNATGMEAAERRMSTLRKMSEGQGWYGRLKLYGFIFGLWLACFLLVFVGPKLRF